ncbi:MAG TPA: class I SAM-dependent methyltransferase [Patescibacteria group bacterium]|nr:class I SAM-dependent methyltransferase [Patescibacteria group bacterium]
MSENGRKERFEELMEMYVDYSNVECFPERIRRELSSTEPYDEDLIKFFKQNSPVAGEIATNPASDFITRTVYASTLPQMPPRYSIDDLLVYSPGGRALFNRLPAASKILAKWITEHESCDIVDLGGGSGSYAFKTIEILSKMKGFNSIVKRISWTSVDIDSGAIELGKARSKADGLTGQVFFEEGNFMSKKFPTIDADLVVLIGVLCGMTPEVAVTCLEKVRRFIETRNGEIYAATLLTRSFEEDPICFRIFAKLGWHLKPKTEEEVRKVFNDAGYEIIDIHSERDTETERVPGQYAIVRARLKA